jgi:hypothetical protein
VASHDGVDTVLAASKTFWRVQSAYRQSIGYFALDELLALATNRAEEQSARRLWAEIKRLRQEGT